MGYGPEESNTVVELTYNYGKTEYSRGNAYAQVRCRGHHVRLRHQTRSAAVCMQQQHCRQAQWGAGG